MTHSIKGAKGSGSQHTPVESPDNLRSIAYFRILDLVSEGEIAGLVNGQQSIYLDETPLANYDGTSNFPKAHVEARTGTPDQTVIPGFDSTENEISVNVELKSDTPWLRSITNPALSAIRLTLGVPALSKANTSTGDITGYTINYKIELQTDGGAFQLIQNGNFTGKTTTKYQRSLRIDLPTATTGWQVKVTRLTANANSSAIQDTTTVDSYTEIVDSALAYPNSALVGVMGDASQFTNIPQRAYDLWGRIIQVPSNYDVTDRSYTGTWDGTFKPSWTNNPAWIFYDICTNTRYGLGHLVSAAQVDKWELYKIGQYCDELVDDGNGGTEPRFTCNIYLQTQADAYKLLNDLSTVFRGISYWANGMIVASADMPADPVYTYTDANVIDGKFTYSASARKTRYSSALVSWNDPRNFYRTKIEYVEDAEGIARYGFQQATATAVGCTSQGQAQRFGKWLLLTSRLETDTVTFSVGLEGTVAAPGQIIRVADSARAGKRQGGRVHSATTTAVTVDNAPTVAVGDSLTVIMPDGVSQTRTVSAVSGKVITVSAAFTSAPLAESVWTVESSELAAQTYRVLAVTEDKSDEKISFTITALQHNASKFAAVDEGTSIVVPPISALTTGVQSSPLSVTLSAHAVVGQVATYSVLTISWEAAPGAIRYEVEWRRDDGEWLPIGNPYGLSVDVVGVSAGNYTARVRAIGRDGNASLPRESTVFAVADASDLPTSIGDIQGQADDAQAAADAATTALAAIASDNVLSAGEKPTVIRDYSVITTEQAGIDAQASAYGITTTKTAYDSAVTALTTYLGTLTGPKAWNDLTGDTTIVGSTFRSKFATVYTTRQALLNAIYAAAKAKADAAQATADAKTKTIKQSTPPGASGRTVGDIWYDTDDGNKPYFWSSAGAWESVQDGSIAQVSTAASSALSQAAAALTAAQAAQATADGAIRTYYQAAAPTGLNSTSDVGDLWFNTTTNQASRWSGSTWVLIEDNTIATALAAAQSAQTTADGKITAFYATTAPTTGMANGDLWYDTNDNNKPYYYNGSAWVSIRDATIAIAQTAADTATLLASQVAVVNPGFDAGDTGWTKESGWAIKSDGSFGHGAGYAQKSGGSSAAALRNTAVCFVEQGHSYKVQALIKAIGANGQCYARISWRDINDAEIGTFTNGNAITGTTVGGSFAVGQPPAGAVFAHAEIAATGHTAGTYQVDNVVSSLQPATADEIAETAGKKWAAESGADKTAGKSLVVLTDRTLNHIADDPDAGRFAAAESGADKTAGKSLTLLTDRTLANVGDAGGRYAAAEAGADKTAGKSLDVLVDGTNFRRVGAGYTDGSGRVVKLWTGAAIKDVADGVFAGDTITRLGGRTLDNISDGGGRFAAVQAGADKTGSNTAANTVAVGDIAAGGFAAPGRNLLINPTGSMGTYGWLTTSNCTLTVETRSGNSFELWFVITRTAPGSMFAYQDVVPGSEGTGLTLNTGLFIWSGSGTGRADINFIDNDGSNTVDGTVTDNNTANRVSSVGGPADASVIGNTARVRVRIFSADDTVTKLAFVLPQLTKGTKQYPFNAAAFHDRGPALTVPGSKQLLGDQRNLPTRTTTNFPANIPTVISYSIPDGSDSPVSVSCSCAAWVLSGGDYTVSYSASSTSISLVRGIPTNVYFYMDDPDQSGGAKSLIATTNADDAYTGAGRMYLGAKKITVPSSGGSTGSGGGGGGSGRPPSNPI